MTYEAILGPLSRAVCCLVPFAWLPALALWVIIRKVRPPESNPDNRGKKPVDTPNPS
jgi:hypothetical protein